MCFDKSLSGQVSGFLLGFRHDITEILLKVALNTITLTLVPIKNPR
jgi:hypothetical protein